MTPTAPPSPAGGGTVPPDPDGLVPLTDRDAGWRPDAVQSHAVVRRAQDRWVDTSVHAVSEVADVLEAAAEIGLVVSAEHHTRLLAEREVLRAERDVLRRLVSDALERRFADEPDLRIGDDGTPMIWARDPDLPDEERDETFPGWRPLAEVDPGAAAVLTAVLGDDDAR